jgi:hypothetical protein
MSRQHPWRADNPDAVIVARPSKWGNPFKIGQRYIVFRHLGWGMPTRRDVGPLGEAGVAEVIELADREVAVALFRAWMRSRLTTAVTVTDLAPLRGRDLACWCPLDQPCHADVLLELANGDPS